MCKSMAGVFNSDFLVLPQRTMAAYTSNHALVKGEYLDFLRIIGQSELVLIPGDPKHHHTITIKPSRLFSCQNSQL